MNPFFLINRVSILQFFFFEGRIHLQKIEIASHAFFGLMIMSKKEIECNKKILGRGKADFLKSNKYQWEISLNIAQKNEVIV